MLAGSSEIAQDNVRPEWDVCRNQEPGTFKAMSITCAV